MSHWMAVDGCFAERSEALRYATSALGASLGRNPHPAEVGAVVVKCPLGDACTQPFTVAFKAVA